MDGKLLARGLVLERAGVVWLQSAAELRFGAPSVNEGLGRVDAGQLLRGHFNGVVCTALHLQQQQEVSCMQAPKEAMKMLLRRGQSVGVGGRPSRYDSSPASATAKANCRQLPAPTNRSHSPKF